MREQDLDIPSRIAVLEHEIQSIALDVREGRKEQKDQHDLIMTKFDSLSERINVLERWRWMIFGGAVVVGYILAHVRMENLF